MKYCHVFTTNLLIKFWICYILLNSVVVLWIVFTSTTYLVSDTQGKWKLQLDFERNINNASKITRATLQDTEYLEANLLQTHEQLTYSQLKDMHRFNWSAKWKRKLIELVVLVFGSFLNSIFLHWEWFLE